MMAVFDYLSVARRAAIPAEKLAELTRVVRSQYANRELLFELRMLRTLEVVAEGRLTIDEAIAQLASEGGARAAAV